ncbi:MAG: hypothetical protein LBB89_05115 [Treponema sp.]|nr:hypothetical protein [Treponema sp.]
MTVSFPAFSVATSINFAPTYTPDGGWGEHFNASDITYTVTVTGTGVSKTYDSGTGFVAKISEDGYPDGIYTFTQTFTANGNTVGNQIIKVEVAFNWFGQLQNATGIPLSPQAIPSVTLNLSKTVSK